MSTTRARALRWTVYGIGAAMLVVGVVFSSRFGIDPNVSVSPLLDRPVPDREIPLLGRAGTINVADLEGRIVVVNFWGPWCVWCDDEHPHLLAASDAYAPRNVEFLGVAFQTTENEAIEFLDRYGWGENFTYAIDVDQRATIDFGVRGAPETFFVSAEGVVVGKISGPVDSVILSSTIDRILAGERPGSREVGETQTPGS